MNYDSPQPIHYSADQRRPRMNWSLQSSSAFCRKGVSSVGLEDGGRFTRIDLLTDGWDVT